MCHQSRSHVRKSPKIDTLFSTSPTSQYSITMYHFHTGTFLSKTSIARSHETDMANIPSRSGGRGVIRWKTVSNRVCHSSLSRTPLTITYVKSLNPFPSSHLNTLLNHYDSKSRRPRTAQEQHDRSMYVNHFQLSLEIWLHLYISCGYLSLSVLSGALESQAVSSPITPYSSTSVTHNDNTNNILQPPSILPLPQTVIS